MHDYSDGNEKLHPPFHATRLSIFQTPAYLQEDFSEIMKQEEEDSGVHISSVRTSLEEKYRKATAGQDAVNAALYNGDHAKANSRLSDSAISNNNTFLVRTNRGLPIESSTSHFFYHWKDHVQSPK